MAGACLALGAIHRAPRVRRSRRKSQAANGARRLQAVAGTGAVADAITGSVYPIQLVAMADIFQHRMDESDAALSQLAQTKPESVVVPPENKHIGFDAFKKAMDVLSPGDIAILATPLAFRPVHFEYAIERGLHVFMEKPLVADGPTGKRMLELAKKADEKNLKCGVGLMIRHCHGRQELHKRINDGEIGDIIRYAAYRMHGPLATCFSTRKPEDRAEVPWQIERFHSFIWASGGLFSDFYIHQIDECSWMKNAWPIKAQALGGRHFRGDFVDQNFDAYAVEYTFEDGSKFFFDGRTMIGCRNDMSSVVHGTKGSAIVSTSGHYPGKVRTFKGQKQDRKGVAWAYPQPEVSPYTLEWKDLVDAITNDLPYNEVPRARRGVPGHEHGSHGGPHGTGNHLRADGELPARNGAWRGRLHVRRPGARYARQGRPISSAHARNYQRSGVRRNRLSAGIGIIVATSVLADLKQFW